LRHQRRSVRVNDGPQVNASPALIAFTLPLRNFSMKKSILSAAVAAVLMFSLAGLYTSVLARDFIATHVDATMLRTPPNLGLVFLGYLVLATLMSASYPRIATAGGSPAWRGLRFGMLAGVAWLIPYSLVLFGVYRFPYGALPMDFAWALVEQGLGGMAIGLIHGRN
jgi:hypothetical protein